MTAKAAALPGWQARLAAIDPAGWPVEQADDYLLVKAEMNGMDFDQRVLRPWARDPSFYVTVWPHRTDVPSREAPVAEPETHLFAYKYPLSAAEDRKSVVSGKSVSARVDLGGRRIINKNKSKVRI